MSFIIKGGGLIINTSMVGNIMLSQGNWSWTSFRNGDGTTSNIGGGTWRIVGPNDGSGNGWTVIKALAPNAGTLSVSYSWSTADALFYDWPFYYVGATEPTNANIASFAGIAPGNIVNSSPQSGVVNVPHNSGDWVAFAIYSTDTTSGAGTIDLTGLPGTISTVP